MALYLDPLGSVQKPVQVGPHTSGVLDLEEEIDRHRKGPVTPHLAAKVGT